MGKLCGLVVSGQEARLSKREKAALGSKLETWATKQADLSKEPNGATLLVVEGLEVCLGTPLFFSWSDGAQEMDGIMGECIPTDREECGGRTIDPNGGGLGIYEK